MNKFTIAIILATGMGSTWCMAEAADPIKVESQGS